MSLHLIGIDAIAKLQIGGSGFNEKMFPLSFSLKSDAFSDNDVYLSLGGHLRCKMTGDGGCTITDNNGWQDIAEYAVNGDGSAKWSVPAEGGNFILPAPDPVEFLRNDGSLRTRLDFSLMAVGSSASFAGVVPSNSLAFSECTEANGAIYELIHVGGTVSVPGGTATIAGGTVTDGGGVILVSGTVGNLPELCVCYGFSVVCLACGTSDRLLMVYNKTIQSANLVLPRNEN